MDICIKTRVLTPCCCAGSGEEGVMDDVKRDKCVHEVDGHMHKSKSTHILLDTCIQRISYLHPVAVQVVVTKETCGCIACRL